MKLDLYTVVSFFFGLSFVNSYLVRYTPTSQYGQNLDDFGKSCLVCTSWSSRSAQQWWAAPPEFGGLGATPESQERSREEPGSAWLSWLVRRWFGCASGMAGCLIAVTALLGILHATPGRGAWQSLDSRPGKAERNRGESSGMLTLLFTVSVFS